MPLLLFLIDITRKNEELRHTECAYDSIFMHRFAAMQFQGRHRGLQTRPRRGAERGQIADHTNENMARSQSRAPLAGLTHAGFENL